MRAEGFKKNDLIEKPTYEYLLNWPYFLVLYKKGLNGYLN